MQRSPAIPTGLALEEQPWWVEVRSDDVDAHAAQLGNWRLSYDQLSSGRFDGRFTEVRLPHVQVFRESTNCRTRQRGYLSPHSVGFGLPLKQAGDIHLNGTQIGDARAIVCNDAELDLCTPCDFDLGGLVVDASVLKDALERIDPDLPPWAARRHLIALPLAAEPVGRLRRLLTSMDEMLDVAPWLLRDGSARQQLADSFLIELIEALWPAPPLVHERSAVSRKRLVDRACELMRASADEPMSILEVCRCVGASRRKLNYCFRDALGMSPIGYLRAIRLNAVRRELQRCTDPRVGVYDIAVRWGFWHFGQFSADYKRQFGQLPSETLRHARRIAGSTPISAGSGRM